MTYNMNYLRKGLNMTSRKRQRKNYPFTWPRIYKYEELLESYMADQLNYVIQDFFDVEDTCLLYTSPSPRDVEESRMPSSA